MFTLSFNETGIDQIVAQYSRAQAACADPIRIVKDELVQWFNAYERRMFNSEGGAGRSGKWRALSPGYAKAKTKKYPGKTILRRTDRLYSSLTGNTADSIIVSETRKLTLGSRTPYAIFHQVGAARLPRRSPIDITNRDAAEVAAIVRRGIFKAIKSPLKVAA